LIPSFTFDYKINDGITFTLNYKKNIQLPDISQLQEIVDISDPINIYLGNPNLQAERSHSIHSTISYSKKNGLSSGKINFNYDLFTDKIVNDIYIADADSVLFNNIKISEGSRILKP